MLFEDETIKVTTVVVMLLRSAGAQAEDTKCKENFEGAQIKQIFKRERGTKPVNFFRKLSESLLIAGLSISLGITGCGKKVDSVESPNLPPDAMYVKTPDEFITLQAEGLSPKKVADRQVLVTFTEEATPEDIQNVNEWLSARSAKHIGQIPDMALVQYELREGDDLTEVLRNLEEKEGVWIASPNIVLTPLLDPDPNIAGDAINGFYWADKINLREAWNVTTGSSEIPIAIIDSGIRTESGHFNGKDIRVGDVCVFGDRIVYYDNDLNPIEGCETIPSVDEIGHGTATAAIAGARGDDGVGGFGVAWKNPLISVDVTNGANADLIDIMVATSLSIRMGAKIVNVSYSVCYIDENGNCDMHFVATQDDRANFRKELLPTMREAYKNDVMVIFAAGNDGFKNDGKWLPDDKRVSEYYYTDNSIIVGATDDWDDPTCQDDWVIGGSLCEPLRQLFRCECPSCDALLGTGHHLTVEGAVVELSAPGYRIAVPNWEQNDASFGVATGTSLSAPMVAGAAALIFGEHPNFRPVKVKQILLESARKGDGCRDIGAGILDVAAALELADQPNCHEIANITSTTSKPDIYENVVVFEDGESVYYADVQTDEVSQILGTEDCRSDNFSGRPHIWENKIVFSCGGNICGRGGICVYRMEEETMEFVDGGACADINGNTIVYLQGTNIIKTYNIEIGEFNELTLPENFQNLYPLPCGDLLTIFGSKVAAHLRYNEGGEWKEDLFLYDLEAEELNLVEAYREHGGGSWSSYGDKIIFAGAGGFYMYDSVSEVGSRIPLADDFMSVMDPDVWEDKLVFDAYLSDESGIFVINLATDEVKNIVRYEGYRTSSPVIYANTVVYIGPGIDIDACILEED